MKFQGRKTGSASSTRQPSREPPVNSTSLDSLSGLVERVTFFKEETGFAVLKVKAKGHRDLVSVVGNIASINAGEWLHAEGRWVRDREHGLQLKATVMKSSPPTSREGIEKYLGSGMVKGIGPVYARKLVEQFGEKIFEVIEHYSARLEEVEGIGPGRRRKIKEAWAEQKMVREIMVFLHSNGVSTSRAVRIFKIYGDQAIERIRENPYCLAKDIHGIGFKSADVIALNMGVPRDSLMRAEAALAHVLQEAVGIGHCALPIETLLDEATRLLAVERGIVGDALGRAMARRDLIEEEIAGERLIFLPALRTAEMQVASRVRSMSGTRPGYPAIEMDRAIAWWEQRQKIQLAPSQRQALHQVCEHRLLVITGGPGVGKTTILRAVLQILAAKKVRFLLCAPTGRAAKRMSEATGFEARTIHRLLEFQPGGGFARGEGNPLETDLVVVDESSMLDIGLASRLMGACPRGGSLILVGDVDQLPSVGPGRVFGDLIESGIVAVVRLTEVFRQASASRIISAAHAINQGSMPSLPEPGEASDFYFVERDEPAAVAATLANLVKNRIPGRLGCDPILDVQVLSPMHRGALGVRELNLALQNALNPRSEGKDFIEKFGCEFRVGDKVMQTENNYDKEVFNGDIGVVARVDSIERFVVVRYGAREVNYDFGELDEVELAYAITIHKSQGSEFPAVVIPVTTQHFMMLRRNLIYTAVTRGRRFVVLVGQRKALALAIRNSEVGRRYSGLVDRLRAS